MLGRGSKAVNAGPRPDAGPKPKSGAEAQKWGRSPMQGQNPKVNAELEPDVRPKPNAVNARLEPYTGSEPDVGSEPNAVNVGPEPDAGLEPNAVNAGPEPDAVNACSIGKCKRCKSKGCLLVENYQQWEKKTMKEHEMFAIPMQECRKVNWPGRRRASSSRTCNDTLSIRA
ncbi:hypothetical protein CDL15_Pgr008653 [Punica granatum]|uniref:Uncharacterized protein n=1 Tax=Punica granatum TaxID=22663 RepID=A0A218XEL2_PUNGR|nr:hypothetical protein CDL15_Pgr008653 [Punica granatum]